MIILSIVFTNSFSSMSFSSLHFFCFRKFLKFCFELGRVLIKHFFDFFLQDSNNFIFKIFKFQVFEHFDRCQLNVENWWIKKLDWYIYCVYWFFINMRWFYRFSWNLLLIHLFILFTFPSLTAGLMKFI